MKWLHLSGFPFEDLRCFKITQCNNFQGKKTTYPLFLKVPFKSLYSLLCIWNQPTWKGFLKILQKYFPFPPMNSYKKGSKVITKYFIFCDISLCGMSLCLTTFPPDQLITSLKGTCGNVTFCHLNWPKDYFHVLKPPHPSWFLWFYSLTLTMLITFLGLNLNCSISPNILASKVVKMGSFSF